MRPSPSSSSYAFSPFQLTHSRGVRPCFHMLLHQQMNFNSRTHVECDAFPFRTTFSLSNFNSRTHVECDYDCIDCHVEYYNISTHALTWSATRRVCCNVEQTKFQLTHSRGVRPGLIDVCPGCKNFNSRTHVECDLGYITSKDLLDNFNSRTHVECDEICLANRARKAISTHALTWSATFTYSRHPIRKRISTHALTWSATSINHLLPRPKRISTHALTWSATGFCAYPRVANPFQLTHSRGVRPAAIGSSSGGREFQLTHSRGVRLLTG